MMGDISLTAAADSKETSNNSIARGSGLMSATGADWLDQHRRMGPIKESWRLICTLGPPSP